MSEAEIDALKRGGHDFRKLHAAFAAASKHRGQPTVILAKTKKGYGMGGAGESRMTAHQAKKLDQDALRAFRDRFALPLDDDDLAALRFLDLLEGAAEAGQRRRRNADAGIGDGEADGGALARERDGDAAARRGELQRIGDEVEHDLADRARIGIGLRQARLDIERQRDARLLGLEGDDVEGGSGRLAEIDRLAAQGLLAGLHLREVEHVVHEREQVLPALVDEGRVLHIAGMGGAEGLARDHLGEAQHRIQGRALLVRDTREEAGLGGARCLRCLARIGERELGRLAGRDVARDRDDLADPALLAAFAALDHPDGAHPHLDPERGAARCAQAAFDGRVLVAVAGLQERQLHAHAILRLHEACGRLPLERARCLEEKARGRGRGIEDAPIAAMAGDAVSRVVAEEAIEGALALDRIGKRRQPLLEPQGDDHEQSEAPDHERGGEEPAREVAVGAGLPHARRQNDARQGCRPRRDKGPRQADRDCRKRPAAPGRETHAHGPENPPGFLTDV